LKYGNGMGSDSLAMSLSPTPLIYAELLSNIRQVTVIASLGEAITKDTRAELSDDKKLLRLFHDGRTATLVLPAQIAAESKLQKPALNYKEMVWRLPLAVQVPPNRGADFADSTSAPWPASKLSAEMRINCQKCGATIVQSRTVRTWKDLPSENWAEMMDFWHCHKPHDHQHGTANGHADVESKGYGANTRFMAQPGIGFVGLTYFLLSEKDCSGIKVRISPLLSHNFQPLHRVSRRRPSLHKVLPWPGHRYKYPRSKPPCTLLSSSLGLAYPLPGDGLRNLARRFTTSAFLRIFQEFGRPWD
jgi:hypothetical protein